MSDLIIEELEHGWNFLNDGKEEEALNLAIKIEKTEDLPLEQKLKLAILKGNILYALGNTEKSLQLAEKTYREYEKLGYELLLLDAINLKVRCLLNAGKILSKSASDLIKRGDMILSSLSYESKSTFAAKESQFFYLKGAWFFNRGNINLSLQFCEKSLKIIEEFNIDVLYDYHFIKSDVLSLIGHNHTNLGDLNLALEYHEKVLALNIGDSNMALLSKVNNYWEMGYAYYLKGDLEKSVKFFKQCLSVLETLNFLIKFSGITGAALQGLIKALIAKGDHEASQNYLKLFEKINDERPIATNILIYKLLRARILKSSTRPRERAEAEKIFKDIIENEKDFSWSVTNALTEICDLYIKELKLTNDITIIDEINPYISQLIEIAEKDKAYPLLAKTKLLQARIALFQINMGDARRLLTQAQEIADENGYGNLAQTISVEHDNLLGQLDVWENLKKKKVPLSERMNLASLSGFVEDLIETREVKIPDLIKEQPILLLILGEGGVLLLSYPFTDEWKSNEELFGSFLTAFMAFSNEFFVERLNRAIFGQYIVVMENISKYSICYLYKGQTYLAKKKLGYFIERIQNVPSIMATLDKFSETSQVIELKKFPFLEGFITEIFMSSNPGNITTIQ
ncbi:MAG: tetratricopeptide repeat protein [Candidatus Thorarchaeota archaeon]